MTERLRPQAMKTKALYEEALIRLLAKKSLREVTVTELAEESGVSRRAFYRHFSTVDEVYESHVAFLAARFSEYYLKSMAAMGHSFDTMAYLHFAFWAHHREALETAVRNGLDRKLSSDVERRLIEDAGFGEGLGDRRAEVAFQFSLAGLWGVIREWAENGFVESPEEMAKLCSFVPKVLNRQE